MDIGAFTRHPAGLIGQPFYGWFTMPMVFLQAASAAFPPVFIGSFSTLESLLYSIRIHTES